MAYWDKRKFQLVQLGVKVIQLDTWKEERLTQMMTWLHQPLIKKEESLTKLQDVVQESNEGNKSSISITKSNTMIDNNIVKSHSNRYQKDFGDFE